MPVSLFLYLGGTNMYSLIEQAAGLFVLLFLFLGAAITLYVIETIDKRREETKRAEAIRRRNLEDSKKPYDGKEVIRFAESFNRSHGA